MTVSFYRDHISQLFRLSDVLSTPPDSLYRLTRLSPEGGPKSPVHEESRRSEMEQKSFCRNSKLTTASQELVGIQEVTKSQLGRGSTVEVEEGSVSLLSAV